MCAPCLKRRVPRSIFRILTSPAPSPRAALLALDIWMTEGFSPRPHLVFTPPLSLGYESVCEIMDFRLNLGAELDKDAFISSFPPALSIKDVYFPERKLKEIEYAGYTLTLRGGQAGRADFSAFLGARYAA